MKQHIIKMCKAAYIEIRRIGSIRQYLTEDATKSLVNSCILSRLDYCNSLLAGYPQTVIKPLQSYFGVNGTALAWLRTYITGRMQFVSVLGHDSEPIPLSFGVPQGSALGPVLFIMYTKPLSDLIAKHPVKHQSFADDTQLNTSFDSCNIDSAIEIIQHCTNDIQSWMVQNKLQLNEGKSEALHVSTSSSDKDLPTSIQKGSRVVPFVKSVRNLGVILDR